MRYLLAILMCVEICAPARAAETPEFYRDILPILQDHCETCHRPNGIAPMPLITYSQTRPWAQAIAQAIRLRKMPPWFADPTVGHFANDPSLTPSQIAIISDWAEHDAPAGDPGAAPPLRNFISKWQIPPPDAVFAMQEPVSIPERG